jgi:hypothetical protein
MDARGYRRGKTMVGWGLILLVAAALVRLAWEVSPISSRLDLPSKSALYVAMGVAVIFIVAGSRQQPGS